LSYLFALALWLNKEKFNVEVSNHTILEQQGSDPLKTYDRFQSKQDWN
jgi:hypothetical protein